MTNRLCILTMLSAFLAAVACSGGPTAPTGAVGYAGEWVGAGDTGERIAFVISPAQKVTDLTFSYRLGECSGAETVSGLALEVLRIPPAVELPGTTGFSHAARGSGELAGYVFAAEFKSNGAASGSISLITSCGNAGVFWSASRR